MPPHVVLGAGLTGLSAAHSLQVAGAETVVFDQAERPGGHCRSNVVDGYVFDYGPHILFTNDAAMETLIRDLLGDNLRAQEREAFIYHAAYDLYTRFPFQAHLYGLPVPLVRDCLLSLVEAVEARARGSVAPANYEEWMRSTFGNVIAERLMIPYARKIWTVEPATMDFNWIGRRVPTPDVARILTGALTDDVQQVGATSHFWYPWRGGIESLPAALARRVTDIECGRRATSLDLTSRVVGLADGDEVEFDSLVYTLPLNLLPQLVDDLPGEVRSACAALTYQGILNVNLGLAREERSDKHWVYFYEDEFPFHRLSFPANFSPHNVPPGKSSISTEVAFSEADELDVDAAVQATVAALRRARILDADDEIEVIHAEAILPAYVIYDLRHTRSVATIAEWLRGHRVHAAGRFGQWEYLNMDHALLQGRRAALRILDAHAP